MNFTRSLTLGAIAALGFTLAVPLASASDATAMKVALVDRAPPVAADQALAVMLDQQTGGRYEYLAGEGWRFAGQRAPVAERPAQTGDSVSLFIDEPTGFVFTYVVEEGWVFAGTLGKAD